MMVRWKTIALSLALFAAGCGAADGEVVSVEDATTSLVSADDVAEKASDAGEAEDEAAPEDEPVNDEAEAEPEPLRLPTSSEPCVDPPEFVEEGFVEYEMELVGEDRPVGVQVGSQAALDGGLFMLVLHGASGKWSQYTTAADLDEVMSAEWPAEQRIAVIPQAQPSSEAFWTETETFNIEYMEQLFDSLALTFCFDRLDVLARSLGQGSLALTQALCQRALPIDLHVMFGGLLKTVECNQAVAVPIVSIDQFDFHPNLGHSWDTSWNPRLVPTNCDRRCAADSGRFSGLGLALWLY